VKRYILLCVVVVVAMVFGFQSSAFAFGHRLHRHCDQKVARCTPAVSTPCAKPAPCAQQSATPAAKCNVCVTCGKACCKRHPVAAVVKAIVTAPVRLIEKAHCPCKSGVCPVVK
jgi:predicted sulfurtransferase